MNFQDYLNTHQTRIAKSLKFFLPAIEAEPKRLHEAMHYVVLNGGKRIRPLLVYAAGDIVKADPQLLDRCASAVEFIHCYSLVHDDLPAMDNDDLRRGKPTCHKAFDEATAILAGDALQTLAFKILTDYRSTTVADETILKMLSYLADACGSNGMAGGQTIDLQAVGKALNLTQLETLHRLKTGALIRVSVQLGAMAGNCNDQQYQALRQFADEIGLAFQIQDDILDVEGSTEEIGKRQGADIALNKPTFPTILGMQQAKKYLQEKYQEAIYHLDIFGDKALPLKLLANYIVERNT